MEIQERGPNNLVREGLPYSATNWEYVFEKIKKDSIIWRDLEAKRVRKNAVEGAHKYCGPCKPFGNFHFVKHTHNNE